MVRRVEGTSSKWAIRNALQISGRRQAAHLEHDPTTRPRLAPMIIGQGVTLSEKETKRTLYLIIRGTSCARKKYKLNYDCPFILSIW